MSSTHVQLTSTPKKHYGLYPELDASSSSAMSCSETEESSRSHNLTLTEAARSRGGADDKTSEYSDTKVATTDISEAELSEFWDQVSKNLNLN